MIRVDTGYGVMDAEEGMCARQGKEQTMARKESQTKNAKRGEDELRLREGGKKKNRKQKRSSGLGGMRND